MNIETQVQPVRRSLGEGGSPASTVESPEVAAAFSDLDRARAQEANTRVLATAHRNALRRFAYKHRLTLKQARRHWLVRQESDYLALIRAELEHERALREFRRLALIAALTRVIDTDRRLNAAA